ncbi:hypothetical protein COB55_01980 [Candidatus Wolfebacteria bacterium]|nr:MAG: hypothetical protein COB55_01980 [Candidatus Wolfebacteria bacterium]
MSQENKDFKEITETASSKDVARNIFFIVLAVAFLYLAARYLSVDDIRAYIDTAGIFAPVLLVIAKAATIVFAPLSGAPLYLIAGVAFGFNKGFLLMLIGDSLGAIIAFYISRIWGRKILYHFMSKSSLPTVEKLVVRMGEFKTFVKARIFFAGLPELFAYASGLTNVSFAVYFPVYMSVQAVFIAVWVAFGDVLLSGNLLVTVSLAVVTVVLTGAGVYWFHLDLKRSL